MDCDIKSVTLLVVLYGCETWSLALNEKKEGANFTTPLCSRKSDRRISVPVFP